MILRLCSVCCFLCGYASRWRRCSIFRSARCGCRPEIHRHHYLLTFVLKERSK